jgi:hypothetical protein
VSGRVARVTGGAVALAILAAVTGCDASLSKRELVVHFTPEATAEQHKAARDACIGAAPRTSPEPIVHNDYAISRIKDVRFRIDHANDKDIAQLQSCLAKQPGVIGFEDTAGLTS